MKFANEILQHVITCRMRSEFVGSVEVLILYLLSVTGARPSARLVDILVQVTHCLVPDILNVLIIFNHS
jgi:hypothetical protein